MRVAATGQGDVEPPQRSGRRLALSIFVALALHAAPIGVLVWWNWAPEARPTPPPPASLEMLPVPVALPAPRREIPPGPEQIQADAPTPAREKPRPLLPEPSDIPADPTPAPMSEPRTAEPPASETTAPPTAPLPPDDAPAAPADGAAAPAVDALPQWQGAILGHLDRHKRYPRDAARQRREGVPYVRFALDRDGGVLFARLEKSCGVTSLDEEAVALVFRAQPFPKPPPEVPGDAIELVAPVEFFIR